jgi:hypothetical protein
MRRYNLYSLLPHYGRFELIKDTRGQSGSTETLYWAECFTWQELKKLVPYFRKRGWRLTIEAVEENELYGKIHIHSYTYGINIETQLLNACGIKIIMARDPIVSGKQKTY